MAIGAMFYIKGILLNKNFILVLLISVFINSNAQAADLFMDVFPPALAKLTLSTNQTTQAEIPPFNFEELPLDTQKEIVEYIVGGYFYNTEPLLNFHPVHLKNICRSWNHIIDELQILPPVKEKNDTIYDSFERWQTKGAYIKLNQLTTAAPEIYKPLLLKKFSILAALGTNQSLGKQKKNCLIKLVPLLGTDIDKQDNQGNTLLHLSCKFSEHVEITEPLLKAGANTKLKNIGVFSQPDNLPLHIAVAKNTLLTTKLLLEHEHPNSFGRSVNCKNANQETPLAIAMNPTQSSTDIGSISGNPVPKINLTLIELLLNHGAKTNELNTMNNTHLSQAISYGNDELVRLLLRYGANQHLQDDDGTTPLNNAITIRDKGLVKILLEHKADPNLKDSMGRPPLHLAVTSGQLDICEMLLAKGANPILRNALNKTALELAIQHDQASMANLLEKYLKEQIALLRENN